MLCVKLVFVLTLVCVPYISVVHYENIVDQYIMVYFGYIHGQSVSKSHLSNPDDHKEPSIQHSIKWDLTCGIKVCVKHTYLLCLISTKDDI